MAGTVRKNMEAYWGDFGAGEVIQSQWGDDANATLDDALSKSDTGNQAIVSNLVFASAKFPNIQSDPTASNHATRKSWIDTNFLNKITSTQQSVGAGIALAAGKYVTVDAGKVLARWDADNPTSATRFYAIHAAEVAAAIQGGTAGTHLYTYDVSNKWATTTTNNTSYIGVNFPHGATITALRAWMQNVTSANASINLRRLTRSDTTDTVFATVNATTTLTEIADTTPTEVINNDLYGYGIQLAPLNTNAFNIRGIQIDYTVVRPQP